MKLFTYCLYADLDNFDKPLTGVGGSAVRVLNIDGVSVLVSDCEEVTADADNALAHAKVIWRLFEQTTPLPFRFGIVITDQQLRSFITANKVALVNKIEHLRGCVEMDLKMVWHEKPSTAPSSDDEAVGPGTAFLREKRREIVGDERVLKLKKEISNYLAEGLGDLINEEKIGVVPSETVVQSRVFHLVAGSKIQQYRDKVAEMLKNQPESELEVSGPWPPYGFADIGLEFETHFGVS